MTVQELLRSLAWPEVWAVLTKHYPDQRRGRKGYRQAFFFIRECQPADNDGSVIQLEYGEDGPRVTGRKHGDATHYDISSLPLTVNAGCPIEPEWIAANPKQAPHTAAHVLWEMTYYGFSDEQINGLWDRRRRYLASITGC